MTRSSARVKPKAGQRHDHDHDRCVADAVSVAAGLCDKRGARLTSLRRRVLELVWRSHGPVGAYDILEWLRREDGRVAAPPTVYRALDFLLQQKLIHRIESLNAFVGCVDPSRPHAGQYLICRRCGEISEIDDAGIAHAISAKASTLGFAIDRQTVEVHGFCKRCAAKAGAAAHAS